MHCSRSKTIENQKQIAERVRALAEAQKRSDEASARFQKTINRKNARAYEAQKRSEEGVAAFRAKVSQALSDLSQAVVQTNRRIDGQEDARGNGDGSQP